MKAIDRSVLRTLRTLAAPCLAAVAMAGCDRGTGGPEAEPAAGEPATAAERVDRVAAARAGAIDLRSLGYSRGREDAPVQVYEFSDFGCPFCRMFARGTYPQLHEEFVETGLVRWTYVPFVMGNFPNGAESARAAECAGDQGRFWEMHDLLYEEQNEWKGSRRPTPLYEEYAGRLGLDPAAFEACYRRDDGRERTEANNRAAAALQIRGTPSFFINGRMVEGALPVERFREVLGMMAGAR